MFNRFRKNYIFELFKWKVGLKKPHTKRENYSE